jgi:hypothetical protein
MSILWVDQPAMFQLIVPAILWNSPIESVAIQEKNDIVGKRLAVLSRCCDLSEEWLGSSIIVREGPASNADPDLQVRVELFRVRSQLEKAFRRILVHSDELVCTGINVRKCVVEMSQLAEWEVARCDLMTRERISPRLIVTNDWNQYKC